MNIVSRNLYFAAQASDAFELMSNVTNVRIEMVSQLASGVSTDGDGGSKVAEVTFDSKVVDVTADAATSHTAGAPSS